MRTGEVEVNKLTTGNRHVQLGGPNLRQRSGMGRREKGKCKWRRMGKDGAKF